MKVGALLAIAASFAVGTGTAAAQATLAAEPHTLIMVMWVQYERTSIDISQSLISGYKDLGACDLAGQNLQVKPAPNSPVKNGVGDLRVGYICVASK